MGTIKDRVDHTRSILIEIIDKIVRPSNVVEINNKYSIGVNPGSGEIYVSKLPYVMCDGDTRSIHEVDTDTLTEIADILVESIK